jgi:Ca2+-binding RTX toxin-like protein
MAANIEALFLTGSGALSATGNALDNLIRGNSGANIIVGGDGLDILEGGAGSDTLSDTSGTTLFNGGAGSDTINGSSASDLFAGGSGDDLLSTGGGADLILFNRGHGKDTVSASNDADDTLSIGGGVLYADMRLKRSGNNLILMTQGSTEQITFTNWYAEAGNHSVSRLQVIIEGTADHAGGSSDPLRNQAVQSFDFLGLVSAFDAARAANPTLTSWALTNALTQFHLGGSDSAAVGGDLAYRYGRDNTFADVSFNPAADLLSSVGFGGAAQGLQALATLQDSSPRLGG